MAARNTVPMFHRRLGLLAVLVLLAFMVPLLRLGQLTLAKGDALRAEAEGKLIVQRWLPTTRGRILDRKGRVLAQDRPAFDLSADYPVITGQWAFSQAARAARRAHRADWPKLAPAQREALIAGYLPTYQQTLEQAWDEFAARAGVSREEVDERRAEIIADVSRQAATIWERQRSRLEEELNRGRELSEEVAVTTAEVARPIREQTSAHVVLRNVDDRAAFRFPLEAGSGQGGDARLPGMRLVDATAREYPYDEVGVMIDRSSFPGPLKSDQPLVVNVGGVAVHMVGWMRNKLHEEDVARRPLRKRGPGGAVEIDPGGYLPGDAVGHTGIERSSEDTLRGERGSVTEQLDTGTVVAVDATAGRDVKLTIDAALQARIQALMQPETGLAVVQPWQRNAALPVGTPLPAACVVLDVDTGDVLAMVSTPTFTRKQLAENPGSVFDDKKNLPLLNRAVARPYPPGSIVKPLILSAAATAGVQDPGRRIECTGHLLPNRTDIFRCWIYKAPFHTTHDAQLGHSLDGSDAIMVSCNIFFYTLGRSLGPARMTEWYGKFGVGKSALHPSLGLDQYYPGSAGPEVTPPPDDSAEAEAGESAAPATTKRAGVSSSEATLMGIGQGPVAWTPLHAADAYATLARGGVRIVPRLRMDEAMRPVDLGLNKRAVAMALEGLERSVSQERGTGHHVTFEYPEGSRRENTFNVEGVRVWGKSGTADSGMKVPSLDGSGQIVSLDHAWFVVLAGPAKEGRPKYAVALVVENGGSGGRVSGPLCNQVLQALIAEGYL